MGDSPNGARRSDGDGSTANTTKTRKRGFLKLLGASAGGLAFGGVGTATAQSGGESYSNRLDITGANDEPAHYRIEMGRGKLRPDGSTVEKWDSATETTAEGWVPDSNGSDTYYFSGNVNDIESFEFDEGEGQVRVNGQIVDPDGLSTSPDYRTITIVGRGEPTNYVFETGYLEPYDGTSERWDESIEEEGVGVVGIDGWVTDEGSVDKYVFNGEIERFEFKQGAADVLVDTVPVDDPESLTNTRKRHRITVQGEGSPANYRFSVSGELHGMNERWDSVSGNSAEGWVTETSHSDTYTYTGTITEFEFEEGNATVRVDGERVTDPESVPESVEERYIEFKGAGEPARYTLTVTGELRVADDSTEPWDDVSESSAEGWVTDRSDVDRYVYTGELDYSLRKGDSLFTEQGKVDPDQDE
ncbi:hypothetical protein ACFQE1_12065 [Halobium palmae]|uniref:S-layer protein n=1 Tax=Halobium palmae TaxID=1776492 RepID=A0ABD5S072_9EURY